MPRRRKGHQGLCREGAKGTKVLKALYGHRRGSLGCRDRRGSLNYRDRRVSLRSRALARAELSPVQPLGLPRGVMVAKPRCSVVNRIVDTAGSGANGAPSQAATDALVNGVSGDALHRQAH